MEISSTYPHGMKQRLMHATTQELSATRRPIKARSSSTIRTLAATLSRAGVTPNQVSCASVLFSALSSACMFPRFLLPGQSRVIFFMLSAMFIQMRLLCNVLDGLIAIEGGKRTKYGEVFNEIPDRISDTLLLVSAGYATGSPEFGWAAALCAVFTAYIRSFSAHHTGEQDFSGPMAKPHRMFVLTLAIVLRAAVDDQPFAPVIMASALLLICVGSVVTSVRRLRHCVRYISSKD